MSAEARPLGAFLSDPHSPAGRILQRALSLDDHQLALEQWANSMPATAPLPTGSVQIANVRDGTVVVYTANAAVLTALRYRQNELLNALRHACGDTSLQIELKVKPNLGHR